MTSAEPAPTPAPAPQGPVQRVRPQLARGATYEFRFNWPNTFDARVLEERELTTSGKKSVSSVKWDLSVRAAGRERLLEVGEIRPAPFDGASGMQILRSSLVTLLVIPSCKLDGNGQFAGLLQPGRYRQSVLAGGLRALPASVDRTTAQNAYDASLTDEALARTAKNRWASLVSSLVGATLSAGEALRTENEVPIPPLGVAVPFTNTTTVVGPVSCVSETPARCVWIEMTSKPSDEVMTSALAEVRKKVTPDGPTFTRFESSYETYLVTEPGTLLPHWYQLHQAKDFELVQNGEKVVGRETEKRTETFEYRHGG